MQPPMLLFLLLLLSTSLTHHFLTTSAEAEGGTGGGVQLWCVAKNNAEDGALQAALDWACSPTGGGVDCGPVIQGGACFSPDDLQFHASYAFNEYYRRHQQLPDACEFAGNAALSQLDPTRVVADVGPSCKFPSSFVAGNGSFAGSAEETGLGPPGFDNNGVDCATVAWHWAALLPLLIACNLLFLG